jgi:multicomponent Na+:H+ antiporter subunit C
MEAVFSLLVGLMVAVSVYLMLARNFLRFLFGLILLSNAVNLVIFVSGRLVEGVPAILHYGEDTPAETLANALPQALVLTAIVIGFGLFAFALVLALQAYRHLGTLDTDSMRLAEPRPRAAEKAE